MLLAAHLLRRCCRVSASFSAFGRLPRDLARCLPAIVGHSSGVSVRAIHNASAATRPLRMAIIGSGPAGFYTAYRTMQKVPDARIDVYEQLPVPFGLVRFGVAPDHPEVKNCQDRFEDVASSDRFQFIGNVTIGRDVSLQTLSENYDALLFAYGASNDRRLEIPGEDLPEVFSARDFVNWYNGLPGMTDLAPCLTQGEEAVVIGQGNVALDVARILLTPVDALRTTDISEQALTVLAESKIRHVRVVGRRGPLQAAFTVKEVRELMNLPLVGFVPIDQEILPLESKGLLRPQKRLLQLLQKGSAVPLQESPKSWKLDFLLSPTEFREDGSEKRLGAVEMQKMAFADPTLSLSRDAKVVKADGTIKLPASIAFRSIGYKSRPLPGLDSIGVPFDSSLGIIPNDLHGRVLSPDMGPGPKTAGHVPGMYCAGWVKRGPTGVIARTMDDAFITADCIAQDWQSGVPFLQGTGLGWDGVKDEVAARNGRRVSWGDWKRIDRVERERGRAKGKPREKIADVDALLRIIDLA